MTGRRLTLRHEVLAELTTDELSAVGAASGDVCVEVHTIPTRCRCTGQYPSLNEACTGTAVCR